MIAWQETIVYGGTTTGYTRSTETIIQQLDSTSSTLTRISDAEYTNAWSLNITKRTLQSSAEGTRTVSTRTTTAVPSETTTQDLGGVSGGALPDSTVTSHVKTRNIRTSAATTFTVVGYNTSESATTVTRFGYITTTLSSYTQDTDKTFFTTTSDTVTSISYTLQTTQSTRAGQAVVNAGGTELDPGSYKTIYKADEGEILFFLDTFSNNPYNGQLSALSDVATTGTMFTAYPWSATQMQEIKPFGNNATVSAGSGQNSTITYDALEFGSSMLALPSQGDNFYKLPIQTDSIVKVFQRKGSQVSFTIDGGGSQSFGGVKAPATVTFYRTVPTTVSGFSADLQDTFSYRALGATTTTRTRLQLQGASPLNTTKTTLYGQTGTRSSLNFTIREASTLNHFPETLLSPQNLRIVGAGGQTYGNVITNIAAIPAGVIVATGDPPEVAAYYDANPSTPLYFDTTALFTAKHRHAMGSMTTLLPRITLQCYTDTTLDEFDNEVIDTQAEATVSFSGLTGFLTYTKEETSTINGGGTFTYASEITETFMVQPKGNSYLTTLGNRHRTGGRQPHGTQMIQIERGIADEFKGNSTFKKSVQEYTAYTLTEAGGSTPAALYRLKLGVDIAPTNNTWNPEQHRHVIFGYQGGELTQVNQTGTFAFH